MSGRCLSCNAILSDEEMTTKVPNTNEYQDLCFVCTAKANDDLYDEDINMDMISIDDIPETLE